MTLWRLARARILLVEDDSGDALLASEALEESGLPHELVVVTDGAEALAYLRREGVHAEARRPDLVLLDLNLPKIRGPEVLASMKADPDLRQIPVVVLTTSTAETDVETCYDLQASGYLTKSASFDDFLASTHTLVRYWFSASLLSNRRD